VVDWKRGAAKARELQACVNNLVWDNGYTQAVNGPARRDALLDIYLLRPEVRLSLVILCPESATITRFY
jgi:hypothetical protein